MEWVTKQSALGGRRGGQGKTEAGWCRLVPVTAGLRARGPACHATSDCHFTESERIPDVCPAPTLQASPANSQGASPAPDVRCALPAAFNHILTDVSLVVYQFEAIAGFSGGLLLSSVRAWHRGAVARSTEGRGPAGLTERHRCCRLNLWLPRLALAWLRGS